MVDASAEFDEFVAAKAHALLRVAFLLAGDQHLAEDHLQEALERVYKRWDRIRDSPESYARKVLVNRSIDYWRWRRRRPEVPLVHETGVVADQTACGF
jgi:RNA polymerase sigma factor (sigma-70 family)